MFQEQVFSIQNENDFNRVALAVFKFQFENNRIYRSYCDLLYKHPSDVKHYQDIPFLPIQFFKSHVVSSTPTNAAKIFTSSGTTGTLVSKHYVSNITTYISSFNKSFEQFYGPIENYVVLALLPSYLERDGSSLVYMANHFIQNSPHKESGFYLHDLDALARQLITIDASKKVLLLGVSFALLDLIERHSFQLKNTIVMETGGMKGRRKELIRSELHEYLKKGFNVTSIHSEYGMTELLSQAYSKGNGLFKTPNWMTVLTRDTEDPFTLIEHRTGGINIIDLANYESCAFIATQDLGRVYENQSFEIIGRFDHSDVRGCNLMSL